MTLVDFAAGLALCSGAVSILSWVLALSDVREGLLDRLRSYIHTALGTDPREHCASELRPRARGTVLILSWALALSEDGKGPGLERLCSSLAQGCRLSGSCRPASPGFT